MGYLELGTRVKHKLTAWDGIVIGGKDSGISNVSGTVAFNEVQFFNSAKSELVNHLCIVEELIVLKEQGNG